MNDFYLGSVPCTLVLGFVSLNLSDGYKIDDHLAPIFFLKKEWPILRNYKFLSSDTFETNLHYDSSL